MHTPNPSGLPLPLPPPPFAHRHILIRYWIADGWLKKIQIIIFKNFNFFVFSFMLWGTCRGRHEPSFYVRVKDYLDFIYKHVPKASQNPKNVMYRSVLYVRYRFQLISNKLCDFSLLRQKSQR
jgi:hypothetical protein